MTPAPFARKLAAAVLSALAVGVVALVGTTMLYFGPLALTNQDPAAIALQVANLFVFGSLVVFVLTAVLALVGGYTRWYFTLVAGVVAGLLGWILGTIIRPGVVISPESLGSLFWIDLPFVVIVVIATITLGVWIWRLVLAGRGASARRIAIVRPPSSNLADGQLTHLDRVSVDLELADRQWDGYVTALAGEGWEVVEVPLGQGLADSVFVEDTVVMFGRVAVLTSPGAPSRQAEVAGVERTVRDLGLRVERITEPGTLDGGDVLKVGSTVYVGRGGRTNAEGIRQLRAIADPLGYTVVAVPVSKALHLKSAVTALPDGTVIGHPSVVDDVSVFERFLPMPEHGAAVIVLGPDAVLMAASAPQSAALVAELGYRVVTVDVGEFEKLEGCVTCLSVRVR